MVNVKLLKTLYEILSDGYHSTQVMAFLTGYTNAFVWHEIRMLTLMGFITKRSSKERKNRFEYELSRKFRDFTHFLDEYMKKLG